MVVVVGFWSNLVVFGSGLYYLFITNKNNNNNNNNNNLKKKKKKKKKKKIGMTLLAKTARVLGC